MISYSKNKVTNSITLKKKKELIFKTLNRYSPILKLKYPTMCYIIFKKKPIYKMCDRYSPIKIKYPTVFYIFLKKI